MKLNVTKAKLTKTLQIAAAVAGKRATMPVLACVKLTTDPQHRLRVEATDLDVSIAETVDVTLAAVGGVCLDAKLLAQIAKDAADDLVIEVNDKLRATIRSGGAKYTLNGVDPAEFPTLPRPPELAEELCLGGGLADSFAAVAHAMASDEARYNLCGIHLAERLPLTAITATDGHRLARTVGSPIHGMTSEIVVPRVAVPRVIDFVATGTDCRVAVEGPMIHFVRASGALSVRLVDGRYPDADKVIPTGAPDATFTCDRDALLKSLRRVGLVADVGGRWNPRPVSPCRPCSGAGFPPAPSGRIPGLLMLTREAPVEPGERLSTHPALRRPRARRPGGRADGTAAG